MPGCAHFIRPNVYMGKKGAVSCIGINMKSSRVYPLIHYLVTLRETTPEGRKTMLYNITRRQLRQRDYVMDALTLLEGMRLYWKGQKRCLGACHALELVLNGRNAF